MGAVPVVCVSTRLRPSTTASEEPAPATRATPAALASLLRFSLTPATRNGRSPVSINAGNRRMGAGMNWACSLFGHVSAGSTPPSRNSGALQSCRARRPSRPVLATKSRSRSPAAVAARPEGAVNSPVATLNGFEVHATTATAAISGDARVIRGSSRRARAERIAKGRPWELRSGRRDTRGIRSLPGRRSRASKDNRRSRC